MTTQAIFADHRKRDAAVLALHRAGWDERDIIAALKSARSMTKEIGSPYIRSIIAKAAEREDRDNLLNSLSAMKWQNMPADMLEISARSSNILAAEDVKTLQDFIDWFSRPASEVKSTPKMGEKSYRELHQVHSELVADPEAFVSRWRNI